MSEFRRRLMMVNSGGSNIPNYLCFTALEDGTFTFSIGSGIATSEYYYIEYSLDGSTWVKFNNIQSTQVDAVTPIISAGDKVYWRGSGKYVSKQNNASNKSIFTSTGKFDVSGCLASLISIDDFENATSGNNYCYITLFQDTKVVNAEELILPNFTHNGVYNSFFKNCLYLETMPLLPSTTTTTQCYASMCYGCTSILKSTELPATTLANQCYDQMFYGCSSLEECGDIKATSAGTDSCYRMFYNCGKITKAPKLNVSTFTGTRSFGEMFRNCTLLADISQVLLSATTLNTNCYNSMFSSSGITTSPKLPAITLVQNCYNAMFGSCASLNYIMMLATDVSASNCMYQWVRNVSDTGTFVKNINAIWEISGMGGVPANWTILYYDPSTDKYYLSDKTTECDDHGNPI